MKNREIHYFLGTNSPLGFVGFFEQLNDVNTGISCYVLKGGPGTGKSSLMKNIGNEMKNDNFSLDFIHCSSDPSSLDGIIIKEKNIAVADGTSPHTIEPKYPGAVENIINLGDCWNVEKLKKNRESIIEETVNNSSAHGMCIRFLKAANMIDKDSRKIQSDYILEEKLRKYTERVANRIFKKKNSDQKGKEKKIFLSAITPGGIVFYEDTVTELADEIIVIDDNVGNVNSLFMNQIKSKATNAGYDIISAYCPMNPNGNPEHIIIPQCSVAFVRNHYGCKFGERKTIHATRFLNKEEIKKQNKRLKLNHKLYNELISESISALKNAKEIHDKLECYYIPCMDFSKIKAIEKNTIEKILNA